MVFGGLVQYCSLVGFLPEVYLPRDFSQNNCIEHYKSITDVPV